MDSRSNIINFFTHPLVGIIGSICSVVGLLLAVYFYKMTVHEPLITYYVNPIKTIVVKSGKSSSLEVFYRKLPISTDVTAVQVALWNDGDQVIRRNDILEPIIIKLDSNFNRILEATIQKTSRQVTGFNLDQTKLDQGQLGVLWNVMEKGDGCIIQIIYEGGPDKQLIASGTVVGQQKIKELQYSKNTKSPAEQYQKTINSNRRMSYIFMGFGAFMTVFGGLLANRRRKKGELTFIRGMIFIVFPLSYLALGIWTFYKSILPGPPFGF